jgi:hypothetical protein
VTQVRTELKQSYHNERLEEQTDQLLLHDIGDSMQRSHKYLYTSILYHSLRDS